MPDFHFIFLFYPVWFQKHLDGVNLVETRSHKPMIEHWKYITFKLRHFTVSWKNISSFWIWWQQQVSEKLEQDQQKAGEVGGTKNKHLEEHLQLMKLIINRSVTWLGRKRSSWRGGGSLKKRRSEVHQSEKNCNYWLWEKKVSEDWITYCI